MQAGWRGLDLACGTGDIAFEAARRGATVVGLDITPRMIELARAKPGAGDRTSLGRRRHGSRCRCPTRPFDLVTTGYGLRNVPDLPARWRRFIAC